MPQPSILGRWYANPLPPDEARQLLARSEQREQECKRHGGNTFTCQLQIMVSRFWLNETIHDHYLMLRPVAARNAHGRVLLELVYGQLLISKRLAGGMPHLEEGFKQAFRLFAASDYLQVMNRHRLLRQLPLADTPTPAEPLEALLTTARVIERMKQSDKLRPALEHDPKDTYG
ncbi:MAG: hypothetical protein OQK94_10375 [Gammaproteobacteria bacterium]|nr:hypothetical protein [Gammaproteobacteria bacterium]MCW9089444.1 hypothetical protein [Gammaproteobacteria bacterium]